MFFISWSNVENIYVADANMVRGKSKINQLNHDQPIFI